jgi:protein-disulfide isomerase
MNSLTTNNTTRDNTSGPADAPLVLIEYGDYECPYCGRAYPMVKNIQNHFGERLRFVFRNFPWIKIHPNAFDAAVAAEAAALQNKFWEMHDMIFENQQTLKDSDIVRMAETVGLDLERFNADRQLPQLAEKVRDDFEIGIRLGVNRTPTFFLNGQRFDGHLHEDQLQAFVEQELRAAVTS